MKIIFLSTSLMDTAKAFGIDLVSATYDELEKTIQYAAMGKAKTLGDGIIHTSTLRTTLGITGNNNGGADFTGYSIDELKENLDSAGLLSGGHLTQNLNCIASTEKTIIFYPDVEADHSQSLEEKIVHALDKVCTLEEVLATPFWSAYCKRT